MSGGYRRTIAPAVGRLRTYIPVVNELLARDNRTEDDVRDINHYRQLMERATLLIDIQSSQWIDYLRGLDGQDRIAETLRYDNFNFNDRHFLEIADEAREVIDNIDFEFNEDGQESHSSAHSEHSHHSVANNHQVVNHRRFQPQPQPQLERIRLPKIPLPTFHGDPLKWPTFWQSFETSIHTQPIPAVQKMTYLFTSLKDKALNSVEGYAITSENYPIVIDVLKNRYGNTKALTETLEAELMNLPKANESTTSLRQTSESIERICRQLKQLNVAEESTLIATAIKSKLPYTVLTDLIKAEKSTTASDIRHGLQELVAVREEVHRCYKPNRLEKPQQQHTGENRFYSSTKPKPQSKHFVSRSFPVTISRQSKPAGKKPPTQHNRSSPDKVHPDGCLFCKGHHSSFKCLKLPTREDRTKRLAELHRCFKCLQQGHKTPTCRSPRNCSKCQGNHHAIICPRNQPTVTRPTPLAFASHKPSIQQPTSSQDKTSSCVTVQPLVSSICSPSIKTILMATKVLVKSSHQTTPISALVFFDCGSQTSFITNKFVKKLRPSKLDSGQLKVHTFNTRLPI